MKKEREPDGGGRGRFQAGAPIAGCMRLLHWHTIFSRVEPWHGSPRAPSSLPAHRTGRAPWTGGFLLPATTDLYLEMPMFFTRRAIALFCLGLTSASLALAAPQDYQGKLPAEVEDGMTVKQATIENGKLIVFYGEGIGRATVTISPRQEADPGSARTTSGGATPSAQRALFQLMDQNLATGTKALGNGYATSTASLHDMKVDGRKRAAICGLIERSQAKAGEKQLFLFEHFCASQIGDDIVTVYITTPMPQEARDHVINKQVKFAGIIIWTLHDAHGK